MIMHIKYVYNWNNFYIQEILNLMFSSSGPKTPGGTQSLKHYIS